MSTDTDEGLEGPDRQTEPPENYSTCLDRGRATVTDGGVESEQYASEQTTDVYLGKVRNAWGRGDELVAGSMDKAKADIEERAREIAAVIDGADLPDEADWRAHAVEKGTQVWDVEDWQIVVQTHQIAEQMEGDA